MAASISEGKKRALESPSMAASISEGKKRALEALERRFAAAAKAEQQSAAKKHRPSSSRKECRRDDPSIASSQHPHVSSSTRPKTPLGASESHPANSEISLTIDPNLMTDAAKVTNRKEVVDKVLKDILVCGDKGLQYAKGSRNVGIDVWIPLDIVLPKSSTSVYKRAQALRSFSKRSRRHMSMREHRDCGSFDLPGEFRDFDLFKPMHEMWKEYILDLLKEVSNKQLAQCLLVADLHGAILLVVECKTTAFKGVRGIMIRETAETFGIVTQDSRFRVVPKRGSVFIFQAGPWKITLYGDKRSLQKSGT